MQIIRLSLEYLYEPDECPDGWVLDFGFDIPKQFVKLNLLIVYHVFSCVVDELRLYVGVVQV